MLDFKIRRGLSHELFPEAGKINSKLKIEEGCWYLCTDTADLYLGVNTGEELTLKRINDKASNTPTTTPDDGEMVDELLEVYINENGELAALYSVSGEIIIGSVVSKEYVDEKISGIKVPEIDLDSYATKEDLAAIEIPSIEGLATKQELEEAINNIDFPQVDLEDYVTKEEIKGITEQLQTIENNYVTNKMLENYITIDQGVTKTEVTELVTTEINTVVVEKIEDVIQEKVDQGEISVTADSVSYGDF